MRYAFALVALVACTGWTTAPDGLSARIGDGRHQATLTCTQAGGLKVEVDAPESLDTIVLVNDMTTLHLRGSTKDGRFVSEMPVDGISALVMRKDGSLRVGTGAGAYALAWAETAPVLDRLIRGCGAAS